MGLIPARAGSTSDPEPGESAAGAHPRSRGEHQPEIVRLEVPAGSSPLARGTLENTLQYVEDAGLIPARAGNTPRRPPPRMNPRAHPRSRGEHGLFMYEPPPAMGSSPLARGTLEGVGNRVSDIGLIPARAGNTSKISRIGDVERAHPRSRGEHHGDRAGGRPPWGSSPLARGTQRR